MIKRYCDRCHRKIVEANNASVFDKDIHNNLTKKEVELCNDCFIELKRLESAFVPLLTDLRVNLYQNFMNFRGNQ